MSKTPKIRVETIKYIVNKFDHVWESLDSKIQVERRLELESCIKEREKIRLKLSIGSYPLRELQTHRTEKMTLSQLHWQAVIPLIEVRIQMFRIFVAKHYKCITFAVFLQKL